MHLGTRFVAVCYNVVNEGSFSYAVYSCIIYNALYVSIYSEVVFTFSDTSQTSEENKR